MTARFCKNNIGQGALPIVVMACLVTGTARGGLEIMPAYVEVSLENGRPAGTFSITNSGEKEERYRVNAVYFTFTEEGVLQQLKTGPYCLAPWIVFNPKELTIAPRTQRLVRFAIVPRGQLQPGEYAAAMELESLDPVQTPMIQQDGKNIGIQIATAIMAPVFGTVGKPTHTGEIREVQVQRRAGVPVVRVLAATTGNGRIAVIGNYEIVNASGQTVLSAPLPRIFLFRETRQWMTSIGIKEDISAGKYTLRVSLTAPPEAPYKFAIEKKVQIEWPPAEAAPAVEPATNVPSGPETPGAGETAKAKPGQG